MVIAGVLFAYGLMIAAGAALGYAQAKGSSFLAGLCGAVLVVAGGLILQGTSWGTYLGFAVNVLLILSLGYRYAKTRAVMPVGIMLGMSAVVAGVLFTEIFQ
jgi:uncharacterized membrane protein (UPF0136 family)